MRPRELIVGGFRSYAGETRLCWEGRSLVGVVGPIGSGKSSILDAIAFALYGKTPRVERDTKSLINQRRDIAQVALTFDVEGETYKAVRSLRRNGASAHVLYRVVDGAEEEIADRATEMTRAVESLLGLDFDAFQRSVLLAQNRFAGFLEATATDRNQVLKGVFGFDRLDAMRTVAKTRLDGLGNRLAVLADRRATARSDAEDLEKRRVELKTAEERTTALDGLRAPFEETKELIADAGRRLAAAIDELAKLDRLVDRIPDRADTDRLFAAAAASDRAVAEAEQALEEATRLRAETARLLEQALQPMGGRSGIEAAGDRVAVWRSAVQREQDAAGRLAAARERLVAEETRRAEVEERVAQAEAAARLAADMEEEAGAAAERADAALQAVRQEHRAHAVRTDLVVGEPCPVCEQVVSRIPDEAVPASIEAAEATAGAKRAARVELSAAARDAAEAQAAARSAVDGIERALAEAAAAVEGARHDHEQASLAVVAGATAAAEILGPGDPAESLDRVRASVAEAQREFDAAAAAESASRAAVESERAAARQTAAALAELRTGLATLAGVLGLELTTGEGVGSLAQDLGRVRTEWIERRAAADAAVASARDEAAAAGKAKEDLLEAAGLGAGDDMAEVMAAALAERSAKEAEVHLLEKRLGDLEILAGDEKELLETSGLLKTIHADLAPSRFLEFVLDERRRVLGDLASEHFEMLTAGRYRFDDSGEFQVVDLTAADSIRAPASLSGGETFLASLALALALAEIVAREGGRLDAFFLDEGFGSLDPEHLDLAMSGIERLVSTGADRLVVVVSHVPAMTERLEDLLVLDRDAVTGDTVVVSGGGCA